MIAARCDVPSTAMLVQLDLDEIDRFVGLHPVDRYARGVDIGDDVVPACCKQPGALGTTFHKIGKI